MHRSDPRVAGDGRRRRIPLGRTPLAVGLSVGLGLVALTHAGVAAEPAATPPAAATTTSPPAAATTTSPPEAAATTPPPAPAAAPGPTVLLRPLSTTVITASRLDEMDWEAPRATAVVTADDLAGQAPRSTPEALLEAPGVFVQETNLAGGAPILRGLIGQQVLLLVDGVRLNNGVTRVGANQSLNTIDPFSVERIEIVRGPSSVLFGSDALGGVIQVVSAAPPDPGAPSWGGLVRGRVASAGPSLSTNAATSARAGRVAGRLGLSLHRHGDVRAGDEATESVAGAPLGSDGEQPFTGYDEVDGDLGLAARLGGGALRLQYQVVRQLDAPRTDKCTPLDCIRFTEQLRDLAYLDWRRELLGPLQQVRLNANLHVQREERERRRVEPAAVERERDEVYTVGAFAEASSGAGRAGRLTYGIEWYQDLVSSEADDEPASVRRGRFVDDSRYLTLAAFAQDRVALGAHTVLSAGARLTWNRVSIPTDPVLPEAGELVEDQLGPVGSLALQRYLGDHVQLLAGLHQGFRAANLDDHSALGPSGKGFDLPTTGLHPERSTTGELGVKWGARHTTGGLFYYHDQLDQLIGRVRADCPSTLPACAGEEDVFVRSNVDRARIQGIEAQAEVASRHEFAAAALAWTRGTVLVEDAPDAPLGRIPPLFGTLRLGARFRPQGIEVEHFVRFAAAQRRLSEDDRGDVRICPGPLKGSPACRGTDDWITLGVRGRLERGRVRATLSLENLTNQTYRYHGSGVFAPGFQAILLADLLL